MSLKLIDRSRLKRDISTNALWFQDQDSSVYFRFTKNTVTYFEISRGREIFSGGIEVPLRHGHTSESQKSYDKTPRSDVIEYDNDESDKSWALELIENCEGLEDELAKCLRRYLSSGIRADLTTTHEFTSFKEKYLDDSKDNIGRLELTPMARNILIVLVLAIGGYFYQQREKSLCDAVQCLETGKKLEQNQKYNAALKYFRRGCDKFNIADSCRSAAEILVISKEEKKAVDYLKSACSLGDAFSCHRGAEMAGQLGYTSVAIKLLSLNCRKLEKVVMVVDMTMENLILNSCIQRAIFYAQEKRYVRATSEFAKLCNLEFPMSDNIKLSYRQAIQQEACMYEKRYKSMK